MGQLSLNATQPESIAHGTEILVQAAGVTIAEINEITLDEDPHLDSVNLLGSRRIGKRPGQIEIKGTIKGYWVNSVLRSLWMGLAAPSLAGGGSVIYHSNKPIQRYNIVVQSNGLNPSVSMPSFTLINVMFEKDAVSWSVDKLTDETVSFVAEDILGQ